MNLTTVKYETRLIWIHLSKKVIFTPVANIIWFAVLIWIRVYSNDNGYSSYLGTYILIFMAIWYTILVIIGLYKRFKQEQTFTDPHHTHYYMKNMTMFIIKVGVIYYMIYDFLYPNYNSNKYVQIVYTPAIVLSFIWN